VASSPQFAATARTSAAQFVAADGTNPKTVCLAGSNGTVIEALFVVSNDTTARTVTCYLHDGSMTYILDSVSVPAGTTAIPVVHVPILSPGRWPWIDPNLPKMVLAGGWSIRAAMGSAVSSGREVTVIALHGDF
jgi:hypothetical protein